MVYAEIILPVPVGSSFSYLVPQELEAKARVGCRVVAPFGQKKTYVGIITELKTDAPQGDFEIKPIKEIIDSEPIVGSKELQFWQWMADYYMCSIGDVLKAALPSSLKEEQKIRPKTEAYVRLSKQFYSLAALDELLESLQKTPRRYAMVDKIIELTSLRTALKFKNLELTEALSRAKLLKESGVSPAVLVSLKAKGIVEIYDIEQSRIPQASPSIEEQLPLSPAQSAAFDAINANFEKKNICLLHGVTSSGKTEIYIRLIREMLQSGKQVLYMLPEIALTTQITERLSRIFGNKMGVYHSKISDAQRQEIWQKQASKEPFQLILGARSSLFLAQQNLGLIIVDEEHEQSYKQQDPAPRYNGRDTALMLGHIHGAKVLLGTATPSIETFFNAQRGKYGYVRLDKRFGDMLLPEIEVVDVQDLTRRKLMRPPFSPQLEREMCQALERKEQIILFQNRRGYAPVVECQTCGWVPTCQFCDVSLTFHHDDNRLHCHYCGNSFSIPEKCPSCEGQDLRSIGFGTEKIEQEVKRRFPSARTARLDLDSTRKKDAYQKIIGDFSLGKTDVLIGTQMVSKGLDFDCVHVVGILDADSLISHPDFRSHERAFQMMSQVSGRAGRRAKRGHVILQTRRASYPLINQVVQSDYLGMYKDQLSERREFYYPPFFRLIYVWLKHRDEKVVDDAARLLCQWMLEEFKGGVLGPDKPAVSRVHMLYIRKGALKVSPSSPIAQVREKLLALQKRLQEIARFRSLSIYFDVDPL